jgi:iron complex outermembrane receptor protein
MKRKYLAWAIPMLFSSVAVHAQQAQPAQPAAQGGSSDVGRINVEGQGSPGAGLIQQEETPKARSSVTKEAIDRLAPSNNVFQAINLLPGVSTMNYDATGLFGGNLRVRGFNTDQMGFTLDGAPVNDSGSFSIFPTEYIDNENLEEIFVTQGSADTEAPHIGATGGNIGLVVARPTDKARLRFNQSLGQLNFTRTFARIDTGLLMDRWKSFISYSHSEADKWRGNGGAIRDHVDFNSVLKVAPQSSITAGVYWNRQLNNNFRTLTKVQADQNYNQDFSNGAPTHLTPRNGTAQTETAPADSYYGFALNPFVNYTAVLKGNFQLTDTTRLDVEPYFWYGYGTGGVQLTTLAEGNAANRFRGGVRDINGDRDALDTIMVYRSSVTQTYRPGVTVKVTQQWDNHRVTAGIWGEKARHRQTQPAVRINNDGTADNVWLDNADQFLTRQDGSAYQGRDTNTITTARSYFLQDSANFLNDKLTLNGGLRRMTVKRDFTNYANDGAGAQADYTVNATYAKTLGSIGAKYQFTPAHSAFVNIAQNFKAPGNFSYFALLQGGTLVNGRLTGATLAQPSGVPETSVNMDLGYRYAGERLTFSGTLFNVDFKNRLAKQFDPTQGTSLEINVGDAIQRGFELEAGYKLDRNWTAYGSLSYTFTQMKSNLVDSATQFEPTAGKALPDTPEWLGAASLQWASGSWGAGTSVKYTGRRYATLVNDESAGGFTTVDFNASYKLPAAWLFKNAALKLNISNLTGTRYRILNAGSGSTFTNRAQNIAGLPAGAAPSYYTGAPRFASVTLAADF